jgi:hypothetical protein
VAVCTDVPGSVNGSAKGTRESAAEIAIASMIATESESGIENENVGEYEAAAVVALVIWIGSPKNKLVAEELKSRGFQVVSRAGLRRNMRLDMLCRLLGHQQSRMETPLVALKRRDDG